MAVGFGYVRSEEPTIVDWGAITKQATDSLAALDADRKKRRADIEETSREYYKELADRPVSQNTAFNTFMSDYSSQTSKAMLAITNQLKTGEITEEEFYRKRGNISSQTQIMLSNFKSYAENYDKAIARAGANGLGSAQEAYEKGLGQQFTNFENLRPIIDPNSYEVMFAREVVGPDGETKIEMASANDVFQFSNFTRDKFDLDGAIKNALSKVGVKTYKNQFGELVSGQYIGKGGEVLTDAIKKDAKGIVSQDETVISILTDYGVETTYDFAMLPDDVNNTTSVTERENKIKKLQEQNPDLIYRDSNGKYYVSDSQRESATIFVEEQLTNAASFKKEEAEYRKQDSIDERIKLVQAQTGKLQNKEVVKQTAFDVLVQQVNRDFDFSEDAEQIAQEIEAGTYKFPIDKYKALLQYYNLEFRENAMKDPNNLILVIKNPTDPNKSSSDIKIDLTNTPPSQWQTLFRRKFTGIPGYTEYLASMAKGDISTATFPQGGTGGGGAGNFNKGGN